MINDDDDSGNYGIDNNVTYTWINHDISQIKCAHSHQSHTHFCMIAKHSYILEA